LEQKSTYEDTQEIAIVAEFLKNIKVIGSDFSAVDLVKYLEEDECVENFGQLLSLEKTVFLIYSTLFINWNKSQILFIEDHVYEHANHNNNVPS